VNCGAELAEAEFGPCGDNEQQKAGVAGRSNVISDIGSKLLSRSLWLSLLRNENRVGEKGSWTLGSAFGTASPSVMVTLWLTTNIGELAGAVSISVLFAVTIRHH
jgi:hypothetical protein